MLRKTISKIFNFVILLPFFLLISSGCYSVSSQRESNISAEPKSEEKDYGKPVITGTIETDEITESSGFAASQCQKDVLWTHNDSGDKAFIYAVNSSGEKLGTFLVKGAKNVDWEAISTVRKNDGKCYLFIGDIGNNSRSRNELTIYRIAEPTVQTDKKSSVKNPLMTETAEALKFSYPDFSQDAETLMVHPKTLEIYILTKNLNEPSGIYKVSKKSEEQKTNILEKVSELSVPAVPKGFLTDGSISPDGKKVILTDYFGAYEYILPGDAENFDEIWRQQPKTINLGERKQGEAITYSWDGKSILATSEKKNSPIILVTKD